jgi:hypothetical protein
VSEKIGKKKRFPLSKSKGYQERNFAYNLYGKYFNRRSAVVVVVVVVVVIIIIAIIAINFVTTVAIRKERNCIILFHLKFILSASTKPRFE